MFDGRVKTARVKASMWAVVGGISVLGATLVVAAPSNAEPSVDDVKAKVDALYEQAGLASERVNSAGIDLVKAKQRLAALQKDLDREQAGFESVRASVAASLVAQYQSQSISTTGQVLLSDDPDEFLSQLQLVTAYNDRQTAVLAQFALESKKLELRKKAADRQVKSIAKTEKRMRSDQATVSDRAAEARRLLDSLSEPDRERVVKPSRDEDRQADVEEAKAVPKSERVAKVLDWALSQLGDSYVYGADGPNAFDCSGFTMTAYSKAGISLPHSSRAQRGYGKSVSRDDLQPGDLVFYYSPISHVALYIGNGKIVHAASPGRGVRISPVDEMPIVGAVRLS